MKEIGISIAILTLVAACTTTDTAVRVGVVELCKIHNSAEMKALCEKPTP